MYGFNGDNGTTDFTVYDSVNKLVVALAITVAVMATLSGMAQVFIFRASPQGQKGGAKVAPGGDEDEGGDDGAGEDEDEGGGKRHMRPMFGARTHDGGDDGARVKAGGGGRGGGGVGGGDVVKAGGGRSGGSGEVPAAAADGGSGKLRQPAEMDS
ncbi:hypothetical protein HXX76_014472 [Chlamydomonas incerta]|uniref:Uncharacterized protein n=1 Tax=Chlamydomonas incerta TaxID=51695 RepID=A0A835SCG6_CHLIN|nr:hypothetical protein HXX76_014472 [Chlamydomonas incerta]|eukprot:KAG2424419.1 hypothetical protein HXX76_014472 [Chlamydomonas incerta]